MLYKSSMAAYLQHVAYGKWNGLVTACGVGWAEILLGVSASNEWVVMGGGAVAASSSSGDRLQQPAWHGSCMLQR